jgi:hypothetical protein
MPKTSIASHQTYLSSLLPLMAADDKAGFVAEFIPLDCTAEDRTGFLADLNDPEEGETQWTNLVAELQHIEAGNAHTIDEDEADRVVFFFEHPLLDRCDREVVFTEVGGVWRAEG